MENNHTLSQSSHVSVMAYANEGEQRIFIICIWFGSRKVQRLNLALVYLFYNKEP